MMLAAERSSISRGSTTGTSREYNGLGKRKSPKSSVEQDDNNETSSSRMSHPAFSRHRTVQRNNGLHSDSKRQRSESRKRLIANENQILQAESVVMDDDEDVFPSAQYLMQSRLADNEKNESRMELGCRIAAQCLGANLSSEQLSSYLANCIQLNTANKINKYNAFNLQLIDYMCVLMERNDVTINDFPTMSCSLDASSRIYACRVDCVHSGIMEIATGLACVTENPKQNRSTNEVVSSGEGNDVITGEKCTKKRRQKNVISSLEAICRSSIEMGHWAHRPTIQPDFTALISCASLTQAPNSCLSLLQNDVALVPKRKTKVPGAKDRFHAIPFDLAKGYGLLSSVCYEDECNNNDNFSMTDIRTVEIDGKSNNIASNKNDQVVDDLAKSVENGSVSLQEQVLQMNKDVLHDTVSRDGRVLHDTVSRDGGVLNDTVSSDGRVLHDTVSSDGGVLNDTVSSDGRVLHDTVSSDGRVLHDTVISDDSEEESVNVFKTSCKRNRKVRREDALNFVKDKALHTSEKSVYSFFDTDLLPDLWAGPAYWKPRFRRKSLPVCIVEKPVETPNKKSQKNNLLSFENLSDNDFKFEKNKLNCKVKQGLMARWMDNSFVQPLRKNYKTQDLFCSFLRETLFFKPYLKKHDDVEEAEIQVEYADDGETSFGEMFDENIQVISENESENCNNEPMFSECDDDLEVEAEEQAVFENIFNKDSSLLSRQNVVQNNTLTYETVPKKLDMKVLKNSVWKLLEVDDKKNGEVIVEESSVNNRGELLFSNIYKNLQNHLPDAMKKDTSPALVFLTLLHLANEKTLKLKSFNSSMTEVLIEKDST